MNATRSQLAKQFRRSLDDDYFTIAWANGEENGFERFCVVGVKIANGEERCHAADMNRDD